jgi:hypothetical protein
VPQSPWHPTPLDTGGGRALLHLAGLIDRPHCQATAPTAPCRRHRPARQPQTPAPPPYLPGGVARFGWLPAGCGRLISSGGAGTGGWFHHHQRPYRCTTRDRPYEGHMTAHTIRKSWATGRTAGRPGRGAGSRPRPRRRRRGNGWQPSASVLPGAMRERSRVGPGLILVSWERCDAPRPARRIPTGTLGAPGGGVPGAGVLAGVVRPVARAG